MKICVTSDLHGILPKIEEPCEVVLICGDIMPLRMQRNIPQSEKWLKTTFAEWVNNLPCESVIMVGGNHDFALANMYRQPLKINSILSNPTNGKLELLDNEATSVVSKDGKVYDVWGTPYCTGTSNCYLAMKYDMPMMGTHPHEWFMFHGAMYGYKQANYMALEDWVEVYDGDLGIALSDTYTSAVFFKNLSRKQAKLFDGVRQDSGDEFKFVTSAIARYKELGIDPTTKTIIFSNALTFEKALEIREYCRGRIRCAFGIGTNLTNDTGHKPSNIVMKLTSCQMNKNQPVFNCVKLSDDLGKHTGLEQEVEHCMNELGL